MRGERVGDRALLALLLLACLALVLDTGRVPLFEPDEGRYAEIPREMLERGDFVTPRLNGLLYFEKPPLHYWAVAASIAAFGPSETAVRLPVKAAGLLCVLLTTLFVRRRWGDATGSFAGLVVASSLLVVALARINVIDLPLTAALTGAAFSFAAFQEAEAAREARRAGRALYALHACCAAAMLLKGLIGVVLPGGAIVAFVALSGRWRLVPRLFAPGPLLVFVALAAPWHVLVARRNPDWFDFYVIREHLARFASKGHRREGPVWYFLPVLVGGFLPWTVFAPALARAIPRPTRAAVRDRGTEAFLAIFAFVVVAFFSVSKSKLIPYVAPVWPVLAALLALGVARSLEAGHAFRGARWLAYAFFAALAAGGVVYGVAGGYGGRFGITGSVWGVVGAAAIGAGVALGLATGKRRPRSVADLALPVAGPWVAILFALVAGLPSAARSITPVALNEALGAEIRPGDVLLQNGHYLQTVPYYAKRTTFLTRLPWSELDFGLSAEPGRMLPIPAFVSLWNSDRRVFAVTYRSRLVDWGNPDLGLKRARVMAVTPNRKVWLLANFRSGEGETGVTVPPAD